MFLIVIPPFLKIVCREYVGRGTENQCSSHKPSFSRRKPNFAPITVYDGAGYAAALPLRGVLAASRFAPFYYIYFMQQVYHPHYTLVIENSWLLDEMRIIMEFFSMLFVCRMH
jgi:hypothetical protein